MDKKIIKLLQEKPIIIPKLLFNNYKKLNIKEEELIIIIFILNISTKIKYNPQTFVEELNIDKYKVMEIINNLMEKGFLNIDLITNSKNIKEEYLSLEPLFNKILNLIVEKEEPVIDNDIFTIFEQELGRPLSPMEYEMIKEWINNKISQELIIEALRESVMNGVNNFRYIDKILYAWNKKGYKTKKDIIKDKEQRFSKKEKETKKIEVFDYNWLEDE